MPESEYKRGSLTLAGTVSMGTGVMIGAGIFALTGQVAEFSGPYFPLAFLVAAVVSAFSAYSYIKVTRKYPSAGGIGMILHRAYGSTTVTGAAALMMAISMVINESLVARTFGTYTLRAFGTSTDSWGVPVLAVGLIAVAFLINIAGNKVIGTVSKISAILKVGGVLLFALATLWAAGFSFAPAASETSSSIGIGGFGAAVAIAILAYKGFTTITNSGDEVENPKRNVGRAIMISLAICLVTYLVVAWAVGSTLTISEIVEARDYSLAEAARPAFGEWGVWVTVGVAIIATASGLLASIFAVSRMLAMLTDMNLIPHRHFGMPGDIQKHTLVYTVVLAGILAAFFDLGRIASLGAIFYLIMDIIIHWGVFRHLRKDVAATSWILLTAIALDAIALGSFLVLKGTKDPMIIGVAAAGIVFLFLFERFFLQRKREAGELEEHEHAH